MSMLHAREECARHEAFNGAVSAQCVRVRRLAIGAQVNNLPHYQMYLSTTRGGPEFPPITLVASTN